MDRWLLQSQSSWMEDAGVPLEEMICPLTNQVMVHPVMHRRYGYSCEQSAIDLWFEQRSNITSSSSHTKEEEKEASCCYCPLTGLPLQRSDFVPNRALQDYIMDWRQAHLIMSPKEQQPAERQTSTATSSVQKRQSTLRETTNVAMTNDDPIQAAASSSAVPSSSRRHVVPLLVVVDGENNNPSRCNTSLGDGKTTTSSSTSRQCTKRAILAFTNAAGTQSLLLLTNALAA